MKKPIKITLWVLFLLVAGVSITAAVGLSKLDAFAKGMLEGEATAAFGLDTTTRSVNVSILTGDVGVHEFQVANVAGYKAEHFLSLDDLEVNVKLGTLFEETLEVPSIVMSNLEISIEQQGLKSNVKEILSNIRDRAEEKKKGRELEGDRPVKKFRIDELRLRNVVARVRLLPVGGDVTTVEVKLPTLVLHDVTPKGATAQAAEEVLRQVLPAILAAVLERGRDVLPEGFIKDLGDELGKTVAALGEGAQKLLGGVAGKLGETVLQDLPNGLGKGIEKLGEGLKEGVEGIGDKIKDVLPGKKEEEPE